MEDNLITSKTAKLAKEKGFIIKTKNWYDQTEALNPIKGPRGSMCYDNIGYAPTQSLLQKWLREIHSIIVFVTPLIPDCNEFGVTIYSNKYSCELDNAFYKTYEEALEIGLQEALKLLSDGKKD